MNEIDGEIEDQIEDQIEVTPEAPPRSRRTVTAAAVLVFALVLGIVAVFAGRRGGPGGGHTSLVPLPAGAGSGLTDGQAAGASASQASPVVPGVLQPAGYQYQIQGTLPTLADHAKAYRPDGAVAEAAVVKLAKALGLVAPVTAESSGWSVTDAGHRLQVTKDNGQWFYSNTAGNSCVGIAAVRGGQGGIVCSEGAGGGSTPGVAGGQTGVAGVAGVGSGQAKSNGGPPVVGGSQDSPAVGQSSPSVAQTSPAVGQGSPPAVGQGSPPAVGQGSPPIGKGSPGAGPGPVTKCLQPPCPTGAMCAAICMPEPTPVADLLSPQDALKRARDVLGRAGVDLTGADVKVSAGPLADVITVDPAVASAPIVGMTTSLTLGSKGAIEFAQGVLARLTQLGDYPLVGTKAGFERLQTGKWLFGGGPRPLGLVQGGAPAAAPGGLVKVTGVHLALVRVFGGDGHTYLEPAYIFETAETWSTPPVPAVADSALQIVPSTRTPLPQKPARSPKQTLVPPPGFPATGAGAG